MEYAKQLLELVAKFKAAEKKATTGRWEAAKYAAEIRACFAKRGKTGEGWEQFCREILGREPGTISEYIRGYEYQQEYAKEVKPENLPPVSMVALLASARPERRAELHVKLFSNKFSADDFRDELRGLQAPPGPTGPADGKKRPGKPGKRQKGYPERPKPQKTKTAELPGLFPAEQKEVLTLQSGNWVSVCELVDSVASILNANKKRLTAWSVIVVPPQGDGVVQKAENDDETEFIDLHIGQDGNPLKEGDDE